MIAQEMAGPREHLKFYDKFRDLITRKVNAYITFTTDNLIGKTFFNV